MRNCKLTIALLVVGGLMGWMFVWSANATFALPQNAQTMNTTLTKSTHDCDWGDAPDPTYPSLAVNDGPKHILHNFWLGEGVSGETDSRQVDNDTFDDGIHFLGSSPIPGGPYNGVYYLPGEYGAVTVFVNGEYDCDIFIHGWIDWNRDGDWDDEGENIFSTDIPGAPRSIEIEFPIPAEIEPGDTWARFRVDDQNLNSITGVAQRGEVEDYHLVDWLVPVELDIFEAKCNNETVQLYWRTSSETENLGFDIYRAESLHGEFRQINAELIASLGTSEHGGEYCFTDDDVVACNTYYYKLADVDYQGNTTFHGPIEVVLANTPYEYHLAMPYPNPFNPATEIEFTVEEYGSVTIAVYDITGRFVRALHEKVTNPGVFKVSWDGTDARGEKMSTGTYLIKMNASNYTAVRKVILVK